MTRKEFRRLSRKDLIDIIFELQKRERAAAEALQKAREELASRELKIGEAGSIAEAALSIHEVLNRTQEAADQYLAETKRHCDLLKTEAERILAEAREKAADPLA